MKDWKNIFQEIKLKLEINDFSKKLNQNNHIINNIKSNVNSSKKHKYEEKNIDNNIMIYKKDIITMDNSLSNSESFVLNKFSVLSCLPLVDKVYKNDSNNFSEIEFNNKKSGIKQDIYNEKNGIEKKIEENFNDNGESTDLSTFYLYIEKILFT